MSIMCDECKCTIDRETLACGNGCECCNATDTEPLDYYTTCTQVCDEKEVETILEGTGDYHRESNTLYLKPCHVCGEAMEVSGWLDDCEECGELHYPDELCGFEGEEEKGA